MKHEPDGNCPTTRNEFMLEVKRRKAMSESGNRVLYVYHCKCGHRGKVYLADDSHDGENQICESCGEFIQIEWDGGVSLRFARRA